MKEVEEAAEADVLARTCTRATVAGQAQVYVREQVHVESGAQCQ